MNERAARDGFVPRVSREYVGTYRPRVDGAVKASGQAEYVNDVVRSLPGLLHAKVLRSPLPHARIKSMDTSEAEALPGVRSVITYADPAIAELRDTTCGWTSAQTATYKNIYFPTLCDRRVLSDHVTWVGDEAGAVVAADTEEIAAEALRLIKVDWEPLPFALTPDDSLAPDMPPIHPEVNAHGNVYPEAADTGPAVFLERGDVGDALASADAVVEVTIRHHRADHGCLDPRCCAVDWSADKLTCWTNFYQADQTRMHIAEMLGLRLNQVRVICPYVGGSFGRGNTGDQPFLLFTALLSRRTGCPVQFRYSRREDFHDTRNSVDYRMKLGASKDGRITALESEALVHGGGYADHSLASVKLVVQWDIAEILLAPIPNMRLEARGAYTNTIPASCVRGIGNIQFNMALGLAVDEMAEKLGVDPLDIVVASFSHEWQAPPNESLEAVVRAGAERIGWAERHAPGAGPIADGRRRGLGFSFNEAWHSAWQELVRGPVQVGIGLNPDLSVILQAPTVETGTGSNTCAVLACAEALTYLGTKPEDIEWIAPVDTETGLKDMVQTDSAVSYLHAEVMGRAAAELKATICELAATDLGVPAERIDVVGARILVAGSDSGTDVAGLIAAHGLVPLRVTVTGEMPSEKTGAPYLCAFAEVEVDEGTGKVDVQRIVIVHDAGTVMYASGAEAQQIGAQMMGVGEALYEEVVYDKATGIPLTFDWVNYTMPTMLDMPQVEPVLLEVWRGAGEYGACGVGESAVCCTPRAILNAIYNAAGVRINDLPVKPEKVLAAVALRDDGAPGLDQVLDGRVRARLAAARAAADLAGRKQVAP